MSVNHMRNRKQKEMLLAQYFWKRYSFGKKSFISAIFPIISIYNFDRLNVDNPQTKLYQSISKINDINWYLSFNNDIKFKIISDSSSVIRQYLNI